MFKSAISVSLAPIVLFAVTSQPAGAAFSCKGEKSLTVCQPQDDLATDGPKDRVRQSRVLFEENSCSAGEILASGPSDWTAPPYADEIHVVVTYECQIRSMGARSDNSTKQRTKESAIARYDFACAHKQYKYFASGFDFFSDGSRSHWDSQGSSRPIPWQKLDFGGGGARLRALFKVWCE
ncbi:hypothetical protein [Bradyrhizobium sp. NBAIM08]|uniref:hypothetical protein n=1 Tax=Bradyrhizobium sp. NBAIM08 TaxID=2793815 RepID=UPI001CD41ECB|nr:hypothetical protein [Bradyrhizobium sp. NBAIM08]MCA1474303.1 hypothetical protein [Bradyrhizobium sp. NBAIM08]